jgi:hypothetical protein
LRFTPSTSAFWTIGGQTRLNSSMFSGIVPCGSRPTKVFTTGARNLAAARITLRVCSFRRGAVGEVRMQVVRVVPETGDLDPDLVEQRADPGRRVVVECVRVDVRDAGVSLRVAGGRRPAGDLEGVEPLAFAQQATCSSGQSANGTVRKPSFTPRRPCGCA